jgi:LysM repeat protein
MAAQPHRSPARILAPLALIACALAVLAIVLGSGPGDGSGDSSRTASGQARTIPRKQTPRLSTKSTYTVKTGDTLAGIAEKTGVSVERLQELNPELDPQALVSGQKIKLRE